MPSIDSGHLTFTTIDLNPSTNVGPGNHEVIHLAYGRSFILQTCTFFLHNNKRKFTSLEVLIEKHPMA